MKDADGRESEGGFSLWKLDKLMNGELPEAEASALREAVSRSPEAMQYLDTYSALRMDAPLRGSGKASVPERRGRSAERNGWSRFRDLFGAGYASRNAGFALATLLLAGTGMWAWHLQGAGAVVDGAKPESRDGGFSAKGADEAMVRILVSGKEYEAGGMANAGPGETLGVTYRSPRNVSAQIWFREEGGTPEAMSGEGTLEWPSSTGWSPAPVRIVLEGEWSRQTVWVITSFSAFTPAEALQAVEGKASRPDLRADVFRMSN